MRFILLKEYCPDCNKKVEYKVIEGIIKEYKGHEVNVKENVARCVECGKDIFVVELEDANLKHLYDKYREVADIIKPEEIIKFRDKYNISQRELTSIMDWGKMTVNRYEKGSLDLVKLQ